MKGVVGATGLLGSMIASRLIRSGERVRVLTRTETAREHWKAQGAEAVEGDMKDPASLDSFCRGVDTVITTANAIARGGPDTIDAVDIAGNRSLIDAAKRGGVRRFVFVSALGADPESPAPLMRAKALTEAHLRESGVEYTILSPTAFMEIWVAMIIGAPLREGRAVTVIGEGSRKHSFISADDVAAFAVAVTRDEGAANRQLVIGGPEAFSWRDIVAEAQKITGRTIPVESRAPGQPLPGFEEPLATALGMIMAGFEQGDVVIPMKDLYAEFGVRPKPMGEFLRGMLS